MTKPGFESGFSFDFWLPRKVFQKRSASKEYVMLRVIFSVMVAGILTGCATGGDSSDLSVSEKLYQDRLPEL